MCRMVAAVDNNDGPSELSIALKCAQTGEAAQAHWPTVVSILADALAAERSANEELHKQLHEMVPLAEYTALKAELVTEIDAKYRVLTAAVDAAERERATQLQLERLREELAAAQDAAGNDAKQWEAIVADLRAKVAEAAKLMAAAHKEGKANGYWHLRTFEALDDFCRAAGVEPEA